MENMHEALLRLMAEKERIDRRRRKIEKRERNKARIKKIFSRLFEWTNL